MSVCNHRGSVMLEGLFCVFIVCLAMILLVELAKRSQYEALFHYGAFIFTREMALGQSEPLAKKYTLIQLKNSLSPIELKKINNKQSFKAARLVSSKDFMGKLYIRYPSLISFENKNHFEITKKCKFPLSF